MQTTREFQELISLRYLNADGAAEGEPIAAFGQFAEFTNGKFTWWTASVDVAPSDFATVRRWPRVMVSLFGQHATAAVPEVSSLLDSHSAKLCGLSKLPS